MSNPKPLPGLTPQEEYKWAKAFDEAKKRGDPIAALAEEIARQIQLQKIEQELMPTAIRDEDVSVAMNIDFMSDPEFFTDDQGRVRNILMVPGPDPELDNQQRAAIIVDGLVCPTCKSDKPKHGWELEHLDFEPNHICQCENCGNFLWISATRKQ